MTIQPLTDKELEAFFQVYREAFSGMESQAWWSY